MSASDARARLAAFVVAHRAEAIVRSRRLVLAVEAEDLVQDALARTSARAATPADEDGMRAWFHRVLRNLAANRRRALRVRARASTTLEVLSETHAPAPREDPLLRARILEALTRLSYAQRRVIALVYLEERTLDEAATLMACASGTARSHLHRALTSLRASLEPLRSEPPRPDRPIVHGDAPDIHRFARAARLRCGGPREQEVSR
jgi:RNA polymerase sigma factor (sigma-70 family)